VDRQAVNALAIGEALLGRGDVRDVRHPALKGDPAYDVAHRRMRRFGCVVSFTLADADTARRFLGALELVADATSFGGVHSTAERRARWAGNDVAPGFVRFSAGCEDTDDLVRDVLSALDAASQG
jgi:cystathionine gamma-lyase